MSYVLNSFGIWCRLIPCTCKDSFYNSPSNSSSSIIPSSKRCSCCLTAISIISRSYKWDGKSSKCYPCASPWMHISRVTIPSSNCARSCLSSNTNSNISRSLNLRGMCMIWPPFLNAVMHISLSMCISILRHSIRIFSPNDFTACKHRVLSATNLFTCSIEFKFVVTDLKLIL